MMTWKPTRHKPYPPDHEHLREQHELEQQEEHDLWAWLDEQWNHEPYTPTLTDTES